MEINFDLDLLAVCNDGYINSGMVKEFLEENPSLKETVINGDSEDAGQVIASVLKTFFSHQVGELAKKYAEEQFDNWLTEVGAIYYYLTRVMRIDSDYVEDFFFKLCSSKLNDKSIFRTTIKNLNDPEYIKRSGTKRIDEYIACWNAMLHGCTVQRKNYSDWFEKPNLKKTFVLTEENELSEAEAQ